MSEATQVTPPVEDSITQRTHGGSIEQPRHANPTPPEVGSHGVVHSNADANSHPLHHQPPTTLIQKNSPTQPAKSQQQQDINSDTETESTQDRPPTPPTPRSPHDGHLGQLLKVIKEPLQPEVELPEQFQDKAQIQSPIEYSQAKDTLKNLNSKRQLPDSIPTELDSKKIKRNELMMNEVNEKHATRILSKLLKDPWAPPFENPVDADALNLPDYYEIVKRPMDLGSVANMLTEKKYTSVSTFADDVRLVFSNAMLYNANRSDIHKAARNFLNEFEDMVRNTPWDQAYDTKIPEVTMPIIAIPTRSSTPTAKPVPAVRTEVTHIEEPRAQVVAVAGSPPSPPLSARSERSSRNGSHPRSGGIKHGGYNCLVYYQNETIPYDFEWPQLHSREDFEAKLRSSLNITTMVELEIGIKRSKPNFGREVFVQLSPRWEEFPRVSCVLVKHKKQ